METPGTWYAMEESLPEALDFEAREIIRKATAPDRHAWRCEEAKKVARAAAIEAVIFDDDVLVSDLHTRPEVAEAVAAATAMLAVIELHGIGGRLGITGAATDRMPWASSLGKGRKQATDGGAWDGAIESVAGVTDQGLRAFGDHPSPLYQWWPSDQEYRRPVALRLTPNYDESDDQGLDRFELIEREPSPAGRVVATIRASAIPPEWRASIARRAVLVIQGCLPAGMEMPAFDALVCGPWPTPGSTCDQEAELVSWGSVLRDAEREINEGSRQDAIARATQDLLRAREEIESLERMGADTKAWEQARSEAVDTILRNGGTAPPETAIEEAA